MNRNSSALRFNFSLSTNPSILISAVLITILLILSSCDTGSKGRYKFQSDSMHWLQFRGPNASGIAPENADPPVHFSADTNLLWKTEMIPGWSSPCIVNDKIFLTGFNDSDSLLYTIAIGRQKGEILWKDSVALQTYYFLHPVNSYANPTVASDGKKIFAHFPGYGLIAYDLDGGKSWEFQHLPITSDLAGSCSPVVLDSIVIINVNGWEDPRIQAVDCETGDTLWAIRDPEHKWTSCACSASPVLWGDLIIMHQESEIVAYNLHDRKSEWWLATPATGVGTPVVHDDMLYVGTWTNLGEKSVRGKQTSFDDLVRDLDKNGNMKIEQNEFTDDIKIFQRPEIPDAPWSAGAMNDDWIFSGFDSNGDGSYVESEWNDMWEWFLTYYRVHGMLAIPLGGSGERPVTDIKWKINEDSPEAPSPLIVNENVLFIKNGGIMTVINQVTRVVVHKDRIGAAGSYLASPMLAANRIYTCSYNGTVTVLSADDYSVLARNKLRGKIGASPVAVDDVLYVRTDKHLYAFREQ